MKKTAVLLLICLLLSSCGMVVNNKNSEKITVVCTVFPAYDWVKNIAGNSDNVEIFLIPSNGMDIHSYQPTTDDIIKINECDLYICAESADKNMHGALIDTKSQYINISEEETDEHIWFSIEKSINSIERITQRLVASDPENEDLYIENKEKYLNELRILDEEYKNTVNSSAKNTIVVADRFPFKHLTESYNIKYYAAFEGCSAESEVSFETIINLKARYEEEKLSGVIVTESPNEGILKSVINETENVKIYKLDSMQSITAKELDKTSYINIMKNNLSVLKEALN